MAIFEDENFIRGEECNTLNPHEKRKEFLFKWVVGNYLSVTDTMLVITSTRHPNPSFLVAPQIHRHGSVGGGAIFTLGIESGK
jgi:hypothetical protein